MIEEEAQEAVEVVLVLEEYQPRKRAKTTRRKGDSTAVDDDNLNTRAEADKQDSAVAMASTLPRTSRSGRQLRPTSRVAQAMGGEA